MPILGRWEGECQFEVCRFGRFLSWSDQFVACLGTQELVWIRNVRSGEDLSRMKMISAAGVNAFTSPFTCGCNANLTNLATECPRCTQRLKFLGSSRRPNDILKWDDRRSRYWKRDEKMRDVMWLGMDVMWKGLSLKPLRVRVQVRLLKFETTTMTVLVWFDDDELVIRLSNASEVWW